MPERQAIFGAELIASECEGRELLLPQLVRYLSDRGITAFRVLYGLTSTRRQVDGVLPECLAGASLSTVDYLQGKIEEPFLLYPHDLLVCWQDSHSWDMAVRPGPRDPEEALSLQTDFSGVPEEGIYVRDLSTLDRLYAQKGGTLRIEMLKSTAVESVSRWLKRNRGAGGGDLMN